MEGIIVVFISLRTFDGNCSEERPSQRSNVNSPLITCWSSGRRQDWRFGHLGSVRLHLDRGSSRTVPCPAAGTGDGNLSRGGGPEGGTGRSWSHVAGGGACGPAELEGWWVGCWSPRRPDHLQSRTGEKQTQVWVHICSLNETLFILQPHIKQKTEGCSKWQ